MSSASRRAICFVDTNVWLYAFISSQDPVKSEKAVSLIRDCDIVTSTQVVNETGMRFLEGAPVFAVEVRSESDYGPLAEREIASKRADYFSAGTLVVWDVDLLSENVITSYDVDHLDTPTIYRRSDIAKAELALRDWEFPVNKLFE
jgi:Uma2 family endonuclease